MFNFNKSFILQKLKALRNGPAIAATSAEKDSPKPILIPDKIGEYTLAFHHRDVEFEVTADIKHTRGGEELSFSEDGNHVLLDGQVIGEIKNKRLQLMIKEAFTRREPITVYLSAYNDQDQAKMFIAFYQKSRYSILKEQGENFTVIKLSGTTIPEHQDAIELCSVGDEVEVEFDSDINKYVAFCGDVIGYVSKSERGLLEKNPEFFVGEIDTNFEGEKEVYIEAYLLDD